MALIMCLTIVSAHMAAGRAARLKVVKTKVRATSHAMLAATAKASPYTAAACAAYVDAREDATASALRAALRTRNLVAFGHGVGTAAANDAPNAIATYNGWQYQLDQFGRVIKAGGRTTANGATSSDDLRLYIRALAGYAPDAATELQAGHIRAR